MAVSFLSGTTGTVSGLSARVAYGAMMMLRLLALRSLAIAGLAIVLAASPSLAKDGNNGNGNASGQENGNNGNGNAHGQENGNNGNHGNQNGQDNGQGNAPSPSPSSAASTPPSSPSSSPSSPAKPLQPAPPTGTTSEQDIALQAVEDARALPLETIAERVHETTPGDIIDARLVTVNGFLLYEVKVLDGDRLDILYYYAQTGNKVGG